MTSAGPYANSPYRRRFQKNTANTDEKETDDSTSEEMDENDTNGERVKADLRPASQRPKTASSFSNDAIKRRLNKDRYSV